MKPRRFKFSAESELFYIDFQSSEPKNERGVVVSLTWERGLREGFLAPLVKTRASE